MSAVSSIEWTNRSWNPVRGCRRVSPGCERCYAERVAHRFSKLVNGKPGPYHGLTVLGKQGVRWSGEARFVPEALAEPLRWRKPQRVFVNSMSDLFHDDVTNEQIAAVFGVMAFAEHLTFQVLTKRPERMLEWFKWIADEGSVFRQAAGGARETLPIAQRCMTCASVLAPNDPRGPMFPLDFVTMVKPPPDAPLWKLWPLPNVWIGVSAESQEYADERIPLLLKCPAAVRFVSAEPLLGPIDFTHMDVERPGLDGMYQINALTGRNSDMGRPCADVAKLDWVIVGGESGPNSRKMDLAWARSIRDQCREAGTAFFFKQTGRMYTENRGLYEERVGGSTRPFVDGARITDDGTVERTIIPTDTKGGGLEEIPEDLRVRQFPTPAVSP